MSARSNMLGRLTGLDIDPAERERIVDAVIAEAGPLDAEWAALETTLPTGWWVQLDHHDGGDYRTTAGEVKWSSDYQRIETFGPTPAAALHALAQKLRIVS